MKKTAKEKTNRQTGQSMMLLHNAEGSRIYRRNNYRLALSHEELSKVMYAHNWMLDQIFGKR